LFEEGQLEKYQSDLTLLIQTEGELIRKRDELQASAIEAASGLGDMTAQIEASVAAGAKSLTVLGDLVKGTKGHGAATKESAEAIRAQQKAAQEAKRAYEELNREVEAHTKSLIEMEDAQNDVIRARQATDDLREILRLAQSGLDVDEARLRVKEDALAAQAESLRLIGQQEQANLILEEVEQRRLDRQIEGIQEARDEATRAAEQAAEDWQRATDEINRSLTDALLRGFEDGKGFAENFVDTLKNLFKTLVLKPVIEFVLSPISGGIQGVLGSIGIGGGAGQASQLGS